MRILGIFGHFGILYLAQQMAETLQYDMKIIHYGEMYRGFSENIMRFAEGDRLAQNDENILVKFKTFYNINFEDYDRILVDLEGWNLGALALTGKPIVFYPCISQHYTDSHIRSWRIQGIHSNPLIRTVVSNDLRSQWFKTYYPELPHYIINHGINPDQFEPHTGEEERILTVMGDITNRFPQWFNIVPPSGFPYTVCGMFNERIGGSFVERPKLIRYMATHRVCINQFADLVQTIGFPEILMAGIPLITLNMGEPSRMITNGYNGILSLDINEITNWVKILMKDKDMANDIGAKGRELALEHYNIKKHAPLWREVFENI